MPSEKDFSLISVSSDEEDDIVIQAGAVSTSVQETGAEVSGAEEGEDFGDYEDEVPAPRKAQAANDMLTSEEDLNAPMPYAGMQRAIMIGFVLLLVAAVAYWFFIRPVSG